MDRLSIVAGASNLKTGTNPPFTVEDFYSIYPQFGANSKGEYAIPQAITEMYLEMADSAIKKERWHKSWKVAICLYVAHFLTLYARGVADPQLGINGITTAGKTQGLETSVTVGSVSVSTDYSTTINSTSNKFKEWNLTVYGQQLAQLAKLYGKGGMMIR